MEQARFAPLRGQVLRFRCHSHDFTIQLETSWVKRAATAVRPLVYCSATTEASASSVPSEFCSRNKSANSRGKVDENRTSRAVPNSITVLSVEAFSPTTRVKRTGMRTGLASGKNFASLAVLLSCRMRALPVACVGTPIPRFLQGVDAAWVPGLPVSIGQGTRTASQERLHERGQSGGREEFPVSR